MKTVSTLKRSAISFAVLFTFAICILFITVSAANAATFTVTNTDDSGQGSLRQAVLDANASYEDDVIDFTLSNCPCTVTLTSELQIASLGALTINGPGASQLSVSGNDASRVFHIKDFANAIIRGITITRGTETLGGGIRNLGTLTLFDSTISGSSADDGGGIHNSGELTVVGSTLNGNSASGSGGGIYNSGGYSSGPYLSYPARTTIINSTISGNSASATANPGGILTLDPISVGGGGIFNGAKLGVYNSTLSGNSASSGGGVLNDVEAFTDQPAVIINSIIANSGSGGDCRNFSSPFHEDGKITARYTLIEVGIGCVTGFYDNNLTGDPLLGDLQDNGGPTFTHALLPGSPAIDAGYYFLLPWDSRDIDGDGDTFEFLMFDQRGAGFARTVGDKLDIGAFEFGAGPDTDGDGVPDFGDNCPNAANGDQANSDIDAEGDGCDLDDDNDHVPDADDAFPLDEDESVDTDNDGTGNNADTDDDNDGVPDLQDSFPFDQNQAAATYTVDNTSDDASKSACTTADLDDCSLRGAINNANIAAGGDTINFAPLLSGGTIILDETELQILNIGALTINGLGANQLTIDAGAIGKRVFNIAPGTTLAINDVTITGGDFLSIGANSSDAPGGGIYNLGTLTLTGTTVRENQAYYGGGIYNGSGGALTLAGSTVSGNDGGYGGGGIANYGTLTVNESTVSGNLTSNRGGGIANYGTMTLTGSTVSGNGSRYSGGGISNDGGTMTLTSSTVSGNWADYVGGGIENVLGTTTLISSTVSGNSTYTVDDSGIRDGGGIYNDNGTMNVGNSIFADNTVPNGSIGADFNGAVVSQGYNLFETAPSSGGNGPTDLVGVDPKLGPLQDYGGATLTQALLCGSPAIDRGKNAAATATDQRGSARTVDRPTVVNAAGGDSTDIGSVEMQEDVVCNTAPVANSDAQSTNEDTMLSGRSVLSNDTDGQNDTLTAVLDNGPSNAQSFTLNADGSFAYTPATNFNGTDSFTYKANDGSLDSEIATVTITVNPVNDAPVVSATPKAQAVVQYSDAIQTVNIGASDVDTPTANLAIAFSYTKDGGTAQPALPTGMVQGGSNGTWTVSGVAGVPEGSYVITATVTDGAGGTGSDTFTIVVSRENATVTPSANNSPSVKVNSSGTAGPITLCADIGDAADGSLGTIANAVPVTFTLAPVAPGSPLQMQDVELNGGTACATFASVPVNVYDITITVGGNYYTGSGSTVLAVYNPALGFTTGGGRVLNDAGNVLHFGFSFKYDKKGFKGQMLVMEHLADGSVVRLKSNSLTSLSIVGNQAIVLGKANIADVGGNFNFRLHVTDNGEPGSSDLFGLTTTGAGGESVPAFSIAQRSILGGNIQVPQKATRR